MWPARKFYRLTSIAVFPLILLAFAAIYVQDKYRYLDLLREDSWVEWLTFSCLLLAGLLSWDIVIQIRQREQYCHWFFVVFGLFCVLVALEEISWGQRIFSFESAKFFLGHSDQQEVNVHNVLQQQTGIKTKAVAVLVLVGYGVVMPMLALNSRIAALLKRLRFIVPPLFLAIGFLSAAILIKDVPTGWEEELGELFFALCLLLFMVDELGKRSLNGRLQPFDVSLRHRRMSTIALDRLALSALTLLALGVRFWQLGQKGLWLGEAANALAARASVGEIIQHTWHAATIEPPTWPLILHFWTAVGSSSEAMLRFLPALAGALSVPILWQLLRTVAPQDRTLRTVAALFVALSPGLLYYAQDVAVYSFIVTLALLSLYAAVLLANRPALSWLAVYVIANWLMLGFHLFTITVIVAEAIFFLAQALRAKAGRGRNWVYFSIAVLLSCLPFLLWALGAPGFEQAVESVRTAGTGEQWSLADHFGQMWRDLIFGSALWQPFQAGRAYLLLPLVALGAWVLLTKKCLAGKSNETSDPVAWVLLLLGTVVVPMLAATFVFQALPSGALVTAVPGLLVLAAAGVICLWQTVRLLGLASLALVLLVSLTGIVFYFGDYQKSAYREMAGYVGSHLQTNDGILLESAEQHLLARYYLDYENDLIPVPYAPLPGYWPASTSPVVPEEVDDHIQRYLREYPWLWLILHNEKDVDPNSFLRTYLTAVSHRAGCSEWRNLELCLFASPHFPQPAVYNEANILYGQELLLQDLTIALADARPASEATLLLTLNWMATAQPSTDYKVSLRLVGSDGAVLAQRDEFPIGPLLPPTTWDAEDQKPGYMALPIPEDLSPGTYSIQIVLYDPATTALEPATRDDASISADTITWGLVKIADDIELLAPN